MRSKSLSARILLGRVRFGRRVDWREAYENGDETWFDAIGLGCRYRRGRHCERYLRHRR